MDRLIIIPQYPTPLRYQEWWYTNFPDSYSDYFDEILVIGNYYGATYSLDVSKGQFAPILDSIQFETEQIQYYLDVNFRKDDVLLLCDLSFPGLFANILFHKRPERCFAICHGTSKNKYDYYQKVRGVKYPIEYHTARLFDKVFVATNYHKEKLGWPNIEVVPFPIPPYRSTLGIKQHYIASVARPGIQKHTSYIEKEVERRYGRIATPGNIKSWEEYYEFLSKSRILLITSKEETFGYQVLDAIRCNCIPLAPNRCSYPELLSKNYLYNNCGELLVKINEALSGELPVPPIRIDNNFFSKTSKIMLNE